MQRRKAMCPHCSKNTEQFHPENVPPDGVRGLGFKKAMNKAGLQSYDWICFECFRANASVFEPGAPTVDLEFLRMKAQEPTP